MKKIEKTLEYYQIKKEEILDKINNNNDLEVDEIISCGKELSILEYKMTALEIALEN